MNGCLMSPPVWFVLGLALGLTSYWHGRVGGPGTTGAPFVLAGLVALVAFTVGGIMAGRR